MPLLLYCIAKPSALLNEPPVGVAGCPVSRLEVPNLAAFVSRNSDSGIWLRTPLRTSALEFHRVLVELFNSAAIIPFRFPTIFEDEQALTKPLDERSDEYNAFLEKFGYSAQMEARVSYSGDGDSAPAVSGTVYLRVRQNRKRALEDVASQLGIAVRSVAHEWRQRSMQSGLLCFALVERYRVAEFKERMGRLRIPAGMSVRVSGPWPVAEFLGEKNSQS